MAGIQLGTGNPNLRALVRDLCFEKSTDTGLFDSDQTLDNYINIAHRRLYNRICALAPSAFAQRSANVTTDSSVPGKYDIAGTTLHAQGVLDVIGVDFYYGSQYIPLEPATYQEPSWPGTAGGTVGGQQPDTYTFLGQTIQLSPEPISPVTIRITYVPGIAAMTLTTDYPFGGNYQQFHELVAYGTALIALSKDKAPQYIKALYEDGLLEMVQHVRSRQRQKSRRVLMQDSE